MLRIALAGQFIIAAETFKAAEYASVRAFLLSHPAAEQQQESITLLLASVLGYGWTGDFEASSAALMARATAKDLSAPQTALVNAFLALIDAAHWDIESARARSRLAIELTTGSPREPLFDSYFRKLARILAAAACFIIGDRVRGERALSARFDPGHLYFLLLSRQSINTDDFPEKFRGYAEFIRVAAGSAESSRPLNGLTSAEMRILRALPSGTTLAEIAREYQKSKSTVARQVESIYQKLNARNRAQAVENARKNGILK